MDTVGHVVVPLRVGGKKMKKRRELDALVAHSLAKRACNAKRQAGNGVTSQDQLLSQSTDDQEDSTWSKVPIASTRCKTKHYSCFKTCGPLVFLISIFILFGFMYWLYFDLRQQIYEHRMKIEEVSASSQFLPDALQKWHEATKLLEHNQTTVNNKLLEIQYKIENFEKELADIKEKANKKDADSEKEELQVLQTSVGNFGAKIKDLTIDVDTLKEHFHKLQLTEDENKSNITQLMFQLDNVLANYSSPLSNYTNEKLMSIVNNVTFVLANDLKNLSAQLIIVNDTLSQKTKGLDDDFHAQKPKFDALIENFANMSSHVTSIEDDWTIFKQKTIDLEEVTLKFNAELNHLRNNSNRLAVSINDIQNDNRRRQTFVTDVRKGLQSNIFQIRKNQTFQQQQQQQQPLFMNSNNATEEKTLFTETKFGATTMLPILVTSSLSNSTNDIIITKSVTAGETILTKNSP